MDLELRNRCDGTRQVGRGAAGRETPEQMSDRLAAMDRDASCPVGQSRHDPRICREGFFRLPARFVGEQREEADGELPARVRKGRGFRSGRSRGGARHGRGLRSG
ncbi:MAG: hypothetical protein LBQ79_03350 [Deltaproteobacteria bacterium]|nr:hypothetical protein [Deltaproteobacteria bacterium]